MRRLASFAGGGGYHHGQPSSLRSGFAGCAPLRLVQFQFSFYGCCMCASNPALLRTPRNAFSLFGNVLPARQPRCAGSQSLVVLLLSDVERPAATLGAFPIGAVFAIWILHLLEFVLLTFPPAFPRMTAHPDFTSRRTIRCSERCFALRIRRRFWGYRTVVVDHWLPCFRPASSLILPLCTSGDALSPS